MPQTPFACAFVSPIINSVLMTFSQVQLIYWTDPEKCLFTCTGLGYVTGPVSRYGTLLEPLCVQLFYSSLSSSFWEFYRKFLASLHTHDWIYLWSFLINEISNICHVLEAGSDWKFQSSKRMLFFFRWTGPMPVLKLTKDFQEPVSSLYIGRYWASEIPYATT